MFVYDNALLELIVFVFLVFATYHLMFRSMLACAIAYILFHQMGAVSFFTCWAIVLFLFTQSWKGYASAFVAYKVGRGTFWDMFKR